MQLGAIVRLTGLSIGSRITLDGEKPAECTRNNLRHQGHSADL